MNTETIRLVQLSHAGKGRLVAMVKEPLLILLKDVSSVYQLAMSCIAENEKMTSRIMSALSHESLEYDSVYDGTGPWKLLPSFDHPENPFACMVSGTGLTHKNSALNRQAMHQAKEDRLTDSMQMYKWGLEGGHPAMGEIGAQPEWFYKGTGAMLRAHGEMLVIPPYGNDGGEEPEIAGIYIIDEKGKPRRIGFTTGNEFSDHIMEKKNYLYLAPSKLRNCTIGPEIVIDAEFNDITGEVSITRKDQVLWSAAIKTGTANMAHSLENLEHHHFKYEAHRVPQQAHVHFMGADAFSFGNQVQLEDGDIMSVGWNGFGRALKNPLYISREKEQLIRAESL
jgi:hypothetical protein